MATEQHATQANDDRDDPNDLRAALEKIARDEFGKQKLKTMSELRILVKQGLDNKTIAERLGIRRKKIKSYRKRYPWYFV